MKYVVVMPFLPKDRFDPVFGLIRDVSRAQTRAGEPWECVRVDKDLAAGYITDKIEAHLRSADICIADLSELRPNVMWEVGFIAALQKPLIAISDATDTLPFNIKDVDVHRYEPGRLAESLERQLSGAIMQTRAQLEHAIDLRRVAVAGSFSIGYTQALAVLRRIAAPYFGPRTTWYCGMETTVELAALELLLVEQRQRVVVLHAAGQDPQPAAAALLAAHQPEVVDVEQMPPTRFPLEGIDRKLAYCGANADVVLLLWDGQGKTMRTFHDLLSNMGREHVLARA